MRVLVTGHNGYLGSVMVPVLQAAGHDVRGLDTYYFEECSLSPDRATIPALRKDIRDATAADLAGLDAVVHLAALCNDPLGSVNPDWTYEINHRASVRLAGLARDAGVSRFLYASSCSLYGGGGGDALLTEEAPLDPLTPYAVSKVRAEEGIAKLASAAFSPVFMRNATAYGASPRLRADVVLNNLTCWAVTTGKIRILSDGTPWRPLVHAEDIARAAAALLAAPREAVHGQAFNVGVTSENYQVRELAEFVREAVPGTVVEFAPQGEPDKRNYRVDFGKLAREVPGFRAKWDARRGAVELAEAYRAHGLKADDFHGGKYTRLARLKELLEAGQLDATLRWKR